MSLVLKLLLWPLLAMTVFILAWLVGGLILAIGVELLGYGPFTETHPVNTAAVTILIFGIALFFAWYLMLGLYGVYQGLKRFWGGRTCRSTD